MLRVWYIGGVYSRVYVYGIYVVTLWVEVSVVRVVGGTCGWVVILAEVGFNWWEIYIPWHWLRYRRSMDTLIGYNSSYIGSIAPPNGICMRMYPLGRYGHSNGFHFCQKYYFCEKICHFLLIASPMHSLMGNQAYPSVYIHWWEEQMWVVWCLGVWSKCEVVKTLVSSWFLLKIRCSWAYFDCPNETHPEGGCSNTSGIYRMYHYTPTNETWTNI